MIPWLARSQWPGFFSGWSSGQALRRGWLLLSQGLVYRQGSRRPAKPALPADPSHPYNLLRKEISIEMGPALAVVDFKVVRLEGQWSKQGLESFIQWSHCNGAWSVITVNERPPGNTCIPPWHSQFFLFYGRVFLLGLRKLVAEEDQLLPLQCYLGQDNT